MPFNLKVMGVDGQRVTFMIDARYRGQEIRFNQSTFSIEPGQTLTLTLNVNVPGYEDVTEMEISPDIPLPVDLPFLYKVESN